MVEVKRGECGFAYPPADGSPDREVIDCFRDFLAVAPPPLTYDATGNTTDGRQTYLDGVAPHRRYAIGYLQWKLMQPVPGMTEIAYYCDNCCEFHLPSEECR